MKNIKPLVSILLPVHNSEKHLKDCLRSLIRQTYRNIEIIAIDDLSSDDSYKILKSFAKKYPSAGLGRAKKVRAYRNKKRYGVAVTLNRLIRKAKGDYIAFMDAADISIKTRIKKQVEFAIQNPEVAAIGSQCRFMNAKGRSIGKSSFPIDSDFIYKSPLHGISMQFETVLINTAIIPKDLLHFQTTSKHFVYSDIFMKLLPYGKLANIPQYLHYHRNDQKEYFVDLREHIFSLIRLWINSISNYDYQRLSVKSFFTPLIKQS
jgi:glycosyltransferase involved in cell wall biosynthesis